MRKALFFLFFILALMLVLTTIVCKKEEPSGNDLLNKKVDKLFTEWNKPDSPGAALAVIKDGSVIYKNGYGSANLEYNIPITPSTIFHVASVSKQFTAFAVVMLADQGKLSLDDDIRKHLPEIPDFGKTVTIQHLVHHISGMRDQWELLAMAGWRLDDVITKEHILTMVRHQRELNFNPGDEHMYCNTGYTLLAEIVERVTGQFFSEWTKANLFKPLGMVNTHFHDDHQMIVKDRAYSYAPKEGGGFRKRVLSYANVGATSLFTTVEDLAKWANNFFEKRLGGPEIIKQMHKQGVLNNGKKISYAFGINIGMHRGLMRVSHGGGDAGFRSHLALFPDQKFAVAILSNLGIINPGRLAMEVADIYLADHLAAEKKGVESSERKIAKIDPSVYEVYDGRYLLEDGSIIKITRENDHLMAEHSAVAEKAELFPESMAKFFLKVVDAQITFHPEKDGYVERLTLHMNGRATKGKRLPVTTLTLDQKKEFAGDYYSGELGTTYKIIIEEGNLQARHRRHGDIPLILTKEDVFTGRRWFFRKVQFIRNEKQKITGFLLTGGRVRNLRFEKRGLQ